MKRATRDELAETWARTDEFWRASFGDVGPEWVRAGFRLDTLKVLLRQRGLRPAPLDLCADPRPSPPIRETPAQLAAKLLEEIR